MNETLDTESEQVTCKKCQCKINWLAVFPGGICVKCHESKFDAQVKRNGGTLPKPNFLKAIK